MVKLPRVYVIIKHITMYILLLTTRALLLTTHMIALSHVAHDMIWKDQSYDYVL